jgi:sulfatase modifying factor 1
MTNCGASSESCCTSLEVPGGTYYRTYDELLHDPGTISAVLAADGGPTGLAGPATVSGFRLDKYEVTVARFRQFVSAWAGGIGWLPAAGSGKHTYLNGGLGLADSGKPGTYETGWESSADINIAPTNDNLACVYGSGSDWTWTDWPDENESLPINCVNWWEAYAFCIWDGGFLPSEAEWEYAAAGGNQQREYPWGSTDPGRANQYAIYGGLYSTGVTGRGIAPVGTATQGFGLWSQLDLAGNVAEWNLDWTTGSSPPMYVEPCVNCASLSTTAAPGRLVPGGDFYGLTSDLLSAYSGWTFQSAGARTPNVGFRCARSP